MTRFTLHKFCYTHHLRNPMKIKHNPGDKMVVGIYHRPVKVKVIEATLWRRSKDVAYLVKECSSNRTHWMQYDAAGQLRKV